MSKKPRQGVKEPAGQAELLRAIGAKIREARLQRGMTGIELAEAIGAAKTWLYSVEEGQQNFTIGGLMRLLVALDLDLRDVLPAMPDLQAETARLRRLHQTSSRLILQLGDLIHELREVRALTAATLGESGVAPEDP